MKKIWFLILIVLSTLVLPWCEKGLESYKTSFNPTNSAATMMNQNIVPWWYLYRNLDLSKAADKEEYEQLQKDRNLILEYQTKTSSAVNKFIDTIHQDLLDACKEYGTGYETTAGTYYERDVCVDHYIRNLYQKLKTELNNPQKNYAWKDPVLLSYYQDLQWDHPFVRYFVDLYRCILEKWEDFWKMPKRPNGWILSSMVNSLLYQWNPDEDWFYTHWLGNINYLIIENGSWIAEITSGIVVNGKMLERIKQEYWYTFRYWPLGIDFGTAPMHWPLLLYHRNKNNQYIYQIISDWGGSGEFYMLVWLLSKKGLWLPLGKCWYALGPSNPLLLWKCKKREKNDPLTIFTQEYNLYEHNKIPDLVENFTFFLRALESTRVLSK